MARLIRSLLTVSMAAVLALGTVACRASSSSTPVDGDEISRVESLLADQAVRITGVAQADVTYGALGPTQQLTIKGFLTASSSDRNDVERILEEFLTVVSREVPRVDESSVSVFVNAADGSFQVNAMDLGFSGSSPSFAEIIDRYGH